jgi:hypothetical protein
MNNVFNDYMRIFGFAEGFATQFSAEPYMEQHHATSAQSNLLHFAILPTLPESRSKFKIVTKGSWKEIFVTCVFFSDEALICSTFQEIIL